ncbi:MAG: glutathione S-transferase [Acidocella sp. 20-57-95]|nr:MAG: glutathione S-transferase [Acidocella sp. 20-57-95]OYV57164.1 MAG: glutathione S-transferase [Acidocella sp. 21-58-7]HQT63450.1 glutathione S-transferase family protein [Acidocella sp.]HQU04926.1 glutathione S-transferase family protein [Acidocella sp.]
MSSTRKLYELASADTSVRFSPYCWRIKLALAHKNLSYETIPWHFTEKDEVAFSGTGKVPILIDGEAIIHDSQAIAEYLEATYPNGATLFNDPATRALTMLVKNWTELTLHPAIARLVVPNIHAMIAPKDQDYFRRTREAVFGETFEEMAAKHAQYLPAFQAALVPLRATLKTQQFIAGTGPAYADHIVFGALQWAKLTSPVPLLEADDPIALWMAALLAGYGLAP